MKILFIFLLLSFTFAVISSQKCSSAPSDHSASPPPAPHASPAHDEPACLTTSCHSANIPKPENFRSFAPIDWAVASSRFHLVMEAIDKKDPILFRQALHDAVLATIPENERSSTISFGWTDNLWAPEINAGSAVSFWFTQATLSISRLLSPIEKYGALAAADLPESRVLIGNLPREKYSLVPVCGSKWWPHAAPRGVVFICRPAFPMEGQDFDWSFARDQAAYVSRLADEVAATPSTRLLLPHSFLSARVIRDGAVLTFFGETAEGVLFPFGWVGRLNTAGLEQKHIDLLRTVLSMKDFEYPPSVDPQTRSFF